MQTNHSFKVGDVIEYSWGWEQTNVNFFQVVGVTKASVKIREINDERTYHETAMVGTTMPKINDFADDKVFTKRVRTDCDAVRMDYGSGYKWDGTPQRFSFYA